MAEELSYVLVTPYSIRKSRTGGIVARLISRTGLDLVAARMFSPGMGIGEDPGTGSAAAALIGLLARHANFDDGQAEFRLRQGLEMGRLCSIVMQLRKDSGVLTHGGIGGNAVIIGEGVLDLRD